jgi:hypothetical protein
MPRGKNPFLIKNGRPSTYKPEYCQDIIKHFSIDVSDPDQPFPTFEGFAAKHCEVTMTTLLEWAKEFPEFAKAYERARQLQEEILIDGLNRGHYKSSPFQILWAKNRMGYKDKTETELSGNAFSINIDLKD